MARISERSSLYIAGMCSLFVGFSLFLVAFGSSSWMKTPNEKTNDFHTGSSSMYSMGLWRLCSFSRRMYGCSRFSSQNVEVEVSRFIEGLTLVLYLALLILLVIDNFTTCTKIPKTGRKGTVIIGAISGLLGMIGAILFAFRVAIPLISMKLSWSFGLAVTGSVLTMIGAILLGVSPSKAPIKSNNSIADVSAGNGQPEVYTIGQMQSNQAQAMNQMQPTYVVHTMAPYQACMGPGQTMIPGPSMVPGPSMMHGAAFHPPPYSAGVMHHKALAAEGSMVPGMAPVEKVKL